MAHGISELSRDPVCPAQVSLRRPTLADAMLENDVTKRRHLSVRQLSSRFRRVLQAPLPTVALLPQGRAEVAQPLQREKVRHQGHHHVVCRDQRATVQRAKVWTNVEQHEISKVLLRRQPDHTVKGGRDSERPRVVVQRLRLLRAQLILHPRQAELPGHERQVCGNRFQVRRLYFASALLHEA